MTDVRIRGTQIGVRDPGLVDRLKADMLADFYAFHELRGQIGGLIDSHGVYHVIEGHHRMLAALEIFSETGNNHAVEMMMQWGLWAHVEHPPIDSRPFPARGLWGKFRNWIGF
jgi:hypothetical protein